MARKELDVDWKIVDEMMEKGAPGTEIAARFGMHPDTLYKKVEDKYQMGFSAYLQQKRSIGDYNIRCAQYDKAVKGKDNSLLIWLGKQRLGQNDNDQKIDASIIIKTIDYSRANNAT